MLRVSATVAEAESISVLIIGKALFRLSGLPANPSINLHLGPGKKGLKSARTGSTMPGRDPVWLMRFFRFAHHPATTIRKLSFHR
jgi:hypothetical protein